LVWVRAVGDTDAPGADHRLVARPNFGYRSRPDPSGTNLTR